MRARLAIAAASVVVAVASSSPASADGVMPAVATPVQREQAQARFARGKELLDKKQYDAALIEFRASHEIVASPNTRLELARCLRAMGRLVAAYAELGRVAVEAKELVGQDHRYQRAYDSATTERAEIQPQLGFVALTIQNPSDDTKVSVGGEELRRAAWAEPAPVTGGAAEVLVETPGHAPVRRTLLLSAGQTTALTIDAQSGAALEGTSAPPPPEPPRPDTTASQLRPWAYVSGGVGAVGLVTFVIAGIAAHSTYNDLNSVCHGGACPQDKSGEISSGRTQQVVANVALALGLVGVAAGTTLFVLSMPKKSSPSAAVVVSPGWMGLRGSW
jgi:hypothetical protein